MLSLKPAPVRWLLRLGGAQTDKMEGIQKLQLTAEKGRYLRPYANFCWLWRHCATTTRARPKIC